MVFLVARAKGIPLNALYTNYQELLLEALGLKIIPPKNANVLQHMIRFLSASSPETKKGLGKLW